MQTIEDGGGKGIQKQRGEKMRIRLEKNDLPFSKKDIIPLEYISWKELFSVHFKFEDQKAQKYSEKMENEDFYLCHWKLICEEDIENLKD